MICRYLLGILMVRIPIFKNLALRLTTYAMIIAGIALMGWADGIWASRVASAWAQIPHTTDFTRTTIPSTGEFSFAMGTPGPSSTTSSSVGIAYKDLRHPHLRLVQIFRGSDEPWQLDHSTNGDQDQQPSPFYSYQSSVKGLVSMDDSPGYYAGITLQPWIPAQVSFWQEFETCAIDTESGEILGSIYWGQAFGHGKPIASYGPWGAKSPSLLCHVPPEATSHVMRSILNQYGSMLRIDSGRLAASTPPLSTLQH